MKRIAVKVVLLLGCLLSASVFGQPIGTDFARANLKVLEGATYVPGLMDALAKP